MPRPILLASSMAPLLPQHHAAALQVRVEAVEDEALCVHPAPLQAQLVRYGHRLLYMYSLDHARLQPPSPTPSPTVRVRVKGRGRGRGRVRGRVMVRVGVS